MRDRQQNTYRSKRRLALTVSFLALGSVLVIFQNFTQIPLERLKPSFNEAHARTISPGDESFDPRDLAPPRPESMREREVIVAPRNGSDLNSISQDWMVRQTNLLTGGAEQKFLDQLNQRMNRYVREEWISSEDDEGDDDSTGDQGTGGGGRKPASKGGDDDGGGSGFSQHNRPAALRFTSINRLQMDLGQKTQVSCSYQGSGLQWDLIHPISQSFDVNLRHEPARSKSSLMINYSW